MLRNMFRMYFMLFFKYKETWRCADLKLTVLGGERAANISLGVVHYEYSYSHVDPLSWKRMILK